jgi:2',3'-cyclic-nucleotide 2'-phosphodiesterase (5'-nucleotidase family)
MGPMTAPRGPTLRIVCVNDVYLLDHLPRLAGLVRHCAQQQPADLMVTTLAGDFLAPSVLSSLDKGRGMLECVNLVPVDIVCFGNHEDDVGIEPLRQRVREFRGTWLNTNIAGFEPALPRSRVLEVKCPGGRSVRVGLLGVVMADDAVYRRPPFGGCSLSVANEAARIEAERLRREERCDCVIPLTHQSMPDDRELARAQQGPRFPLIIGGHEHVPFVEQVEGTWIVKAGSDAVEAAIVDLTWPAEAPANAPDLPEVRVRLEPVANYPEDEALRARVEVHEGTVRELGTATLMHVAPGTNLSSIGTRHRQTSMGTLLCNRLRDALGAEGCLLNGGGVRGSREYTERFTYGDLENEIPFDNEMVVINMPGSVLREAIDSSRAHAPAESGGYLQVDDGIEVDGAGKLVRVGREPFDEGRTYRIAMIRNLLTGMDHIEPLVRFGHQHPDELPHEGSGRGIRVLLVDSFSVELWKHLGGFDQVDANHDGVVTVDEIARAMERTGAEPASKIVVELVMNSLDANHDHSLSRQEVEAVTRSEPGVGNTVGANTVVPVKREK